MSSDPVRWGIISTANIGMEKVTPGIQRSVVAGGRLFTISMTGVRASALDDLADEGFAAFPDPPQGIPVPIDVPPGIPVPSPPAVGAG